MFWFLLHSKWALWGQETVISTLRFFTQSHELGSNFPNLAADFDKLEDLSLGWNERCTSHWEEMRLFDPLWQLFTTTLFFKFLREKIESCSVVSDSFWPHGLNSLGQNTGVGSLIPFPGIFPTQGWNPGLPHCRRILYQLSHKLKQKALCKSQLSRDFRLPKARGHFLMQMLIFWVGRQCHLVAILWNAAVPACPCCFITETCLPQIIWICWHLSPLV